MIKLGLRSYELKKVMSTSNTDVFSVFFFFQPLKKLCLIEKIFSNMGKFFYVSFIVKIKMEEFYHMTFYHLFLKYWFICMQLLGLTDVQSKQFKVED